MRCHARVLAAVPSSHERPRIKHFPQMTERGVLKILLESASYVMGQGETSIVLGRGEKKEIGQALESKEDGSKKLVISAEKKVSREHAKIEWNGQNWTVACVGKNAFQVDKKNISRKHRASFTLA